MELFIPVVVPHHVHLTLTVDFQGQILKILYLRNGRVHWHGTKGMWVDWILDPCCDFQLWPHPWPSPWIIDDRYWNSCIPGMGGPIDMERKGYESIRCYTYFVTLSYDLELFKVIFWKMLYLRNGRADWYGMKGMWVHRILDSHCDFELWPHSWPWPCIFNINFWNNCISGTGGPINMERRIWVDRMLYLLWLWLWPWILKVKFKKKLHPRNKTVNWHGTKRMWIDRMLDPSCDFKLWPHPWPWPWIFKVKFLIAIF